MKKINHLILGCLLLASCETVVDVDLPLEAPSLVANALINPDSLVKVRVSQSRHILDDADFKAISNAKVVVLENGQFKEQLSELADKGLYTSQFTPVAGKEYTLQVEAEDFTPIKASSMIKEKIPIQQIKLDSTILYSYEDCYNDTCYTLSDLKYQVALTFQDPAGEENFYEISIQQTVWNLALEFDKDGHYIITDTVAYTYPVYLSTEDPALLQEFNLEDRSYSGEQLLFSDEILNGKTYTLHFDIDNTFQKNSIYQLKTEVVIFFKHLTESYYLYHRTRELQDQTEDNPFAEPAPVYNNIENGYGIFAGYSADTRKILIE